MLINEFKLSMDRPASAGMKWVSLHRGSGRSILDLEQCMNGTISAHPYHSANDFSIETNAQLLGPDAEGRLYATVMTSQIKGDQTSTMTRIYRIHRPMSESPDVREVTEREVPTGLPVIHSI